MTLDDFFDGHEISRQLFDSLCAVIDAIGPAEVRVSRSQVAFARRVIFARVWIPDVYLDRGAPLVLTLGFREQDPSPRWKQIVEPAPGRFTHHLELYGVEEIDDQVCGWLHAAWVAAG